MFKGDEQVIVSEIREGSSWDDTRWWVRGMTDRIFSKEGNLAKEVTIEGRYKPGEMDKRTRAIHQIRIRN